MPPPRSGSPDLDAAARAIAGRSGPMRALDLVRLLDGPAEGLGGVTVDAYDDVVRIEPLEAGWLAAAPDLARVVVEQRPRTGPVVVVDRTAGAARARLWSLPDRPAAPEGHVVGEAGLRYFVRTCIPRAAGAGVFVDLAYGRARVRDAARGRRVLNLFAHAGAFGVAAAGGGAARVDHVDIAKSCARWAALNLALNGENPRGHRFLVDDACKVLARAAKKRADYGVVVCDPPTAAVTPKGKRFVAKEHLDPLAHDAIGATGPGGAILFSCNDRSLRCADLAFALERGARARGRTLSELVELGLGPGVIEADDESLRSTHAVWAVLD